MATRLTIVDGNNNDKDNVRVYMVKGEKGGATWGQIDGVVSDQTDINTVIDSKIETELANFEHLDYRVVDAVPTPATAEEGVRYLYKPSGATAYNEYILIDGVIYMIGTTEDVDLTDYYTKTDVDDIKDDILKHVTRDAITARMSTGYVFTSLSEQKMNLTTAVTTMGSKITLSNGKIVIGSGISKIRINAQVRIVLPLKTGSYSTNYGLNVILKKNSSEILINQDTYDQKKAIQYQRTANISPAIISVSQGDEFELFVRAQKDDIVTAGANETYVTVEAIEYE